MNLTPKPTVSAGTIVASQRLGVTGTSTSFSVFNSTTDLIVLQVLTADVYCTIDTTTPSSTNGFYLYAGNTYNWNPLTARYAKFIQVSSTAAIQCAEFQVAEDLQNLSDNSPIKSKAPT